jgi:hypothetical protein
MADKKISALTAASTPLAGTEVLPIVQGGATVKVSVDDLTTGKVVTTGPIISVGTGKDRLVIEPQNAGSGALLLGTNSAGNAYTPVAIDNSTTILKVTGTEVARTNSNGIAPVAGKGIDFSANTHAAGMTSELLNDYEEGTWTIGLTFGGGSTGLAIDGQEAFYTRVGRLVHVSGRISLSNKGSSTGSAVLTGLPFTIANSNGARAGGDVSWYAAVLGVASINILGDGGATTAALFIPGATGMTAMTDTNFTNTSSLYFSFTYIV